MFTSFEIMQHAHHVGHGAMSGWWIWVGMAVFWIVLLGLLFGFLGRRWRRSAWEQAAWGHGGQSPHTAANAEVTLAERFAQGDIDEKEYRGRLEVLRANATVRHN